MLTIINILWNRPLHDDCNIPAIPAPTPIKEYIPALTAHPTQYPSRSDNPSFSANHFPDS